jgi:YgiT-type zinc finger domain-containing protein
MRSMPVGRCVMKCIICHSTGISVRRVNDQLSRGKDVILVPVKVLACNNCGERYYDRRTMKRLGEIEDAVNIEMTPDMRDGWPRIAGTRITVADRIKLFPGKGSRLTWAAFWFRVASWQRVRRGEGCHCRPDQPRPGRF